MNVGKKGINGILTHGFYKQIGEFFSDLHIAIATHIVQNPSSL